MLKSNFRLDKGAVTLTRDGFECEDIPEILETHVENWKKKGEEDDETHIENLKKKIKLHHLAVMRALNYVPKYQNQLWAMENLVQRKEEEAKRKEAKAVETARRLQREELEKLKRQEEELKAKKARSKPIPPMNRKRVSDDDEEMTKEHKSKKVHVPSRVYKPRNQQELDRLNAWTKWTENEWRYSIAHGTEAMEKLIARGVTVPEVIPGQAIPLIQPPPSPVPLPIHNSITTPVVEQAAVVEQDAEAEQAADVEDLRAPDSPASDDSVRQAMSALGV